VESTRSAPNASQDNLPKRQTIAPQAVDIESPVAEREPQARGREATEKRNEAGVTKRSSRKDTVQEKPRTEKRAATKTAAKSNTVKHALVQKRAQRRGIRLKADDGQGPSFD